MAKDEGGRVRVAVIGKHGFSHRGTDYKPGTTRDLDEATAKKWAGLKLVKIEGRGNPPEDSVVMKEAPPLSEPDTKIRK